MYVFDTTYLLKASIKVAKKFRVIPSSVFYPPIRVLSPHPCFTPHPCFIPLSVFYPPIRVLSPHPCFIPPSVFYPLIRVLYPHPCFIPSSVFYPLIRVLSPHPCFIPSSVFYPPIRVLSPHPCFIPSSVSVSGHPYPYPYPCFIPTQYFCSSGINVTCNGYARGLTVCQLSQSEICRCSKSPCKITAVSSDSRPPNPKCLTVIIVFENFATRHGFCSILGEILHFVFIQFM